MARILVVDDDESYRRAVKVALTVRGHEVKEASNGFEAEEEMRADPADLVLLDWQMPGMNGDEASRRLRAISRTPIILVSGMDRVSEARELGLQATLRKPVEMLELFQTVDRVLQAWRDQASLPNS